MWANSSLEAILQSDFDHAHHIDVGQVHVADAGAVLVIQRNPGEVGVSGGERLWRVEKREALGVCLAVGLIPDRGVDGSPAHLVESVVEGRAKLEGMTFP